MGLYTPSFILNLIKIIMAILCAGLIASRKSEVFKIPPVQIMLLIMVGSTLFVIVALTLTPGLLMDPSRIAGDVMIGVGVFSTLAIFKEKKIILGITTAASVWMAAAIGLTIGAGLFFEAIFITVFIYLAAGWINKKHIRQEDNSN
ncbi:MAG: MgtC/SapB family protein [Calditrichia bacterium]